MQLDKAISTRYTERYTFDQNFQTDSKENQEETNVQWQGRNCHIISPQIHTKIQEYYKNIMETSPRESKVRHATRRHKRMAKHQKLTAKIMASRKAALEGPLPQEEEIAARSLDKFPLASVRVFDLKGSTALKRAVLVPEGSNNITAERARLGAGYTLQFYADRFNRNSVDNRGYSLNSYVGYGRKYNNAFWDAKEMIYGKGDGKIFTDFTIDPDIIAHELTHGVTQFTSRLVYQDQSGALNEHLSDLMGIGVKQYALEKRSVLFDMGTDAKAAQWSPWLIGERVLIDIGGKPYALRSMDEKKGYTDHPILGTDPQAKRMSDYVKGPDDNGEVHSNSGIPNLTAFLAAQAIGLDKTLQIWYGAMTGRDEQRKPLVKPTAGFVDFANGTIYTATKLFGKGSAEEQSIIKAWTETEVIGHKQI